uniref:uncharacterized protein LOC108950390 isoform X2 n=1 Tax=Ciona intestinalis TaxID=7719 RepID=UPI000EF54CD9|nr:uncharacterized protein LOC108950390 isoform X2 [Ciona intestinalis]|eukprot:XP_026694773.1 uncharacterized protein LOC108950390 isoform X2 [Ciona intestinalis]
MHWLLVNDVSMDPQKNEFENKLVVSIQEIWFPLVMVEMNCQRNPIVLWNLFNSLHSIFQLHSQKVKNLWALVVSSDLLLLALRLKTQVDANESHPMLHDSICRFISTISVTFLHLTENYEEISESVLPQGISNLSGLPSELHHHLLSPSSGNIDISKQVATIVLLSIFAWSGNCPTPHPTLHSCTTQLAAQGSSFPTFIIKLICFLAMVCKEEDKMTDLPHSLIHHLVETNTIYFPHPTYVRVLLQEPESLIPNEVKSQVVTQWISSIDEPYTDSPALLILSDLIQANSQVAQLIANTLLHSTNQSQSSKLFFILNQAIMTSSSQTEDSDDSQSSIVTWIMDIVPNIVDAYLNWEFIKQASPSTTHLLMKLLHLLLPHQPPLTDHKIVRKAVSIVVNAVQSTDDVIDDIIIHNVLDLLNVLIQDKSVTKWNIIVSNPELMEVFHSLIHRPITSQGSSHVTSGAIALLSTMMTIHGKVNKPIPIEVPQLLVMIRGNTHNALQASAFLLWTEIFRFNLQSDFISLSPPSEPRKNLLDHSSAKLYPLNHRIFREVWILGLNSTAKVGSSPSATTTTKTQLHALYTCHDDVCS